MKMSKLEKKLVNRRKREETNIRLIEHFIAQSRIDLRSMSRVLDIGCGVGFVARHLNSNYGLEVIGVDVDPEQIEIAEEYSEGREGLHFAVADAAQLPFKNEYFDMVLSFMVIHHVGNWRRVLEEAGRVLKSQGIFIFYEIAVPGFLARPFASLAKNYGVFTQDELMEYLDVDNCKVIYKQSGRHLIFRVLGLVMRKD